MTDFVEEKLTSWGLEEYITKFKEEGIEEEIFLNMTEDLVKELIPKVGPRHQFITHRRKLRKLDEIGLSIESIEACSTQSSSQQTTSLLSVTDSDLQSVSVRSISPSPSKQLTSSTEKLKKLLQHNALGKAILGKTYLSSLDRKRLCGIIIDHLLTITLKITTEQFTAWSISIKELFPHENINTYFVPYKGGENKTVASGKLWDKYANTKRYINRTVVLQTTVRTVETPDEIKEILTKLRVISPQDPNLYDYWSKTLKERDVGSTIDEYYQSYPVLATPVGYSLLQSDFERMKVIADPNIFLKQWPNLSRLVIKLAIEKKTCDFLCEEAAVIPAETLGLLILPYLFTPSQIETGNKKRWKPSKLEVAEGFITKICTVGDLEPAINRRQTKFFDYGLTVQPRIVIIGPTFTDIQSYYVIINHAKYEASNLMGAVDFCFKSYFALNATYSVDCVFVWTFLQKFVYEIDYTKKKSSKHFITVDTVWSDLQKVSSECQNDPV